MTKKLIVRILLGYVGLHVAVLVGLVVFGLLTGKFDREKLKQYKATWQGEKLVAYVPEPEVKEVKETPEDTKARIEKSLFENELKTRELEKEGLNWKNLMTMVQQARAKLEKDQAEFATKQKAFYDEVEKHNKTVKSEGFQKALKNYSTMKSKLVKDDFMEMPDDEVVRYLAEMKSDIATDILNTFKTDNEQNRRVILLRKLKDYKSVAIKGSN